MLEAQNSSAMIVAHIPPGGKDCAYEWSIRLRALQDRFQHVIRFSIHGHSHFENYSIVKSFSDSKSIGVQYTTGSVSTFEQVYPTFRVFEMDEETFLPVKAHTYKLDIHADNPEWKYDHTMPDQYGMPDLRPNSFNLLA